jgi:hypothetical protein
LVGVEALPLGRSTHAMSPLSRGHERTAQSPSRQSANTSPGVSRGMRQGHEIMITAPGSSGLVETTTGAKI